MPRQPASGTVVGVDPALVALAKTLRGVSPAPPAVELAHAIRLLARFDPSARSIFDTRELVDACTKLAALDLSDFQLASLLDAALDGTASPRLRGLVLGSLDHPRAGRFTMAVVLHSFAHWLLRPPYRVASFTGAELLVCQLAAEHLLELPAVTWALGALPGVSAPTLECFEVLAFDWFTCAAPATRQDLQDTLAAAEQL